MSKRRASYEGGRTRKGVVPVLSEPVEVVLDLDGERAREVAVLDGVSLALPALASEVCVCVEDHGCGVGRREWRECARSSLGRRKGQFHPLHKLQLHFPSTPLPAARRAIEELRIH